MTKHINEKIKEEEKPSLINHLIKEKNKESSMWIRIVKKTKKVSDEKAK
jgi:hypothetical protein